MYVHVILFPNAFGYWWRIFTIAFIHVYTFILCLESSVLSTQDLDSASGPWCLDAHWTLRQQAVTGGPMLFCPYTT